MKNNLETRLGVFFALTVIAAVILLELAGGMRLFNRGIHIGARFTNVLELKEGDPVKVSGLQVGRVQKLELVDGQVEVVILLDKGREKSIRTDSVATIKFMGLMGQNYVAITMGSKGALVEEGSSLKTVEQPDLSQLFTRLDNVAEGVQAMTRSFSGESFQNLLVPFTDFMKEHRDTLGSILVNASNVTAQVASQVSAGEGTIGRLIKSSALHDNAVLTVTNFNLTATSAREVLEEAKALVKKIEAGEGTIGMLANDKALYNEAAQAMTNLKEILQKINQGQGSVGKLVNDESLFKNAKVTLQKLDKATEGLEDQGPLSVLGMAVGKLF